MTQNGMIQTCNMLNQIPRKLMKLYIEKSEVDVNQLY